MRSQGGTDRPLLGLASSHVDGIPHGWVGWCDAANSILSLAAPDVALGAPDRRTMGKHVTQHPSLPWVAVGS